MTSPYAHRFKDEDGTYSVKTPARGFTMIKGLDMQTAYHVENAINRAFANGRDDVIQGFKNLMEIEEQPK